MTSSLEGIKEKDAFLKEWPLSRLKTMSIDEYTNLDRDTSFTYWLEKKTENSGSIWGGSAFKFGIYRRADRQKAQDYPNRNTDGTYAWFKKYGSSAVEAFNSVKNIIVDIAESSSNEEFNHIDDIDFGDSVKWKIAFHYNPNSLIPIFKRAVLARAAEKSGVADPKKLPISKLQSILVRQKPTDEDTIEYSGRLWSQFNIDNFYSIIAKFLEQAQSSDLKKVGYPKAYQGLDVKVSFGAGVSARIPWIAFLQPPNSVSDGIYPVYLYYKDINTLILAYGVSETTKSSSEWQNTSSLETIEQWYLRTHNRKPDRYGDSYIRSIYNTDEEINEDQLQQDLSDIITIYKSQTLSKEDKKPSENKPTKKYWIIAPGEGAKKWDEFYESGIIGLNWDRIDDLQKFDERDAITRQLTLEYPDRGKTQTNSSLALWQFSHEMNIGDILIAKDGSKSYLGYGAVTSDYHYDDTSSDFKHLRKVEWMKRGNWVEDTGTIVIKTLTDITQYTEHVDRLKRMIGIEQDAQLPPAVQHWWINFNTSYQNLYELEVGQLFRYKTHNNSGNKRTNYDYFQKARKGDLVIGFQTSPINKAVALFEVYRTPHLNEDDGKEELTLLLQRIFPDTYSYERLKPCLVHTNITHLELNSISAVNSDDYKVIISLEIKTDKEPYLLEDANKEIFVNDSVLRSIITNLQKKKNVILQGPSGTGKTYLAKKIAFLMLEEKDADKIEIVQFHQSYSYEDFIQGYRPIENGKFKLTNGVFYRFCKKAVADPGNKYFFIIDEINRGNLSKIFGELMLLVEADKRGQENAMPLTYGSMQDNKFFIPENVFIIGTMNTADRSLAVVDYALRRRFAFVDINPSFNQNFINTLKNNNVDEGIIQKIIDRISSLNRTLVNDESLGEGFQIGHSYFCNFGDHDGDEGWYQSIIDYEIGPLLKEYWFDNSEKALKMIDQLKK